MDRFIRDSAKGEDGRVELRMRLERPVYEKTVTGGRTVASTIVLPEQVFALMPLKRRQTNESNFTLPTSGKDEVKKVEYVLIGSLDCDAERGDLINWAGDRFLDSGIYRVEYVGVRLMDRRLVGINFHAARN